MFNYILAFFVSMLAVDWFCITVGTQNDLRTLRSAPEVVQGTILDSLYAQMQAPIWRVVHIEMVGRLGLFVAGTFLWLPDVFTNNKDALMWLGGEFRQPNIITILLPLTIFCGIIVMEALWRGQAFAAMGLWIVSMPHEPTIFIWFVVRLSQLFVLWLTVPVGLFIADLFNLRSFTPTLMIVLGVFALTLYGFYSVLKWWSLDCVRRFASE